MKTYKISVIIVVYFSYKTVSLLELSIFTSYSNFKIPEKYIQTFEQNICDYFYNLHNIIYILKWISHVVNILLPKF